MKTHNFNLISKTLSIMNIIFNYKQGIKKFGAITTLILALFVSAGIQAQTTATTDAGLVKDAGDGVSVKLIDNKGTIKYLQTNNGITSITSTTAGSATTTTWQLGGTLTDDTYIDVDGNVFGLDGIELVDPDTEDASTDATTESDHGTGTGYTILVRDEATGATKKLLASDLIQSGYAKDDAEAADETANSITIAVSGIPELDGNEGKISVYRNGVKLLHTYDFTVITGTSVTVSSASTPANFSVYTGDVFEVQWVK